jgi:TonB family protein
MRMLLLMLTLSIGILSSCGAPGDLDNKETATTQQQPSPQQQAENTARSKAGDECDFSSYKPSRVSHFVQFPLKTKVKPSYPSEAVRRGLQGKISVKILVNRDGDVVKACALNGDEVLRRAAEEAALKWKFKRKVAAGRESFVEAGISFNFVLDKNDPADAEAVRP